MRERLVKAARAEGLAIKQSYQHVGRRLLMQSSRYAHARQMKRARACTRKLKTQLGRVMREIECQAAEPSVKLDKLLRTAHRIHEQQKHDRNEVYSVHEPEVQCIAKGNAGKQYEFGNKVSVAVSSRGGWFVGAKSFTGNPYDGHTLSAQMKQVENIIGAKVSEAYVDMGRRGHDYGGAVPVHVDKRRRERTSEARWRWMKRRAAVEPSIGHLKSEHRLERNRLKGTAGNEINAILAAAAMNLQKLLGAFRRIFLFCLTNVWNELLTLQGPQARNTRLQYA
jgi:IS5 family transposase